ncbi:hypothetical protein [Cupriavidus basilensis]|uniref:Uncharacterized protein n=1 Tax=Cupriavidus basilensis TaxID=68895 RepID=A0A0C4YLP9_9BURK|nr:hypothetical protein [Cupriavidus basilensis]AJG23983.1 hypothetical protein RR42_s2401 [Cupriavidus basilensis]
MNKLRSSRLLDRISPSVLADLRRMRAVTEAERALAAQAAASGAGGAGAVECDNNPLNDANYVEIARYDPRRGRFVMERRRASQRVK